MSTVYDEKLLDKVGLAMVPSGYTNNVPDVDNLGGALGKVYSVLPIQTTGENLVTNGDFSDGSTGWDTSIGTAFIANGVAEWPDTTNSFVRQFSVVDSRVKTYILTYTVKTSNQGYLMLGGGSSAFGTVTLPNTVGTHSVTLTSNGITALQFFNNSSFVGTIDDISLVKVIDGDFRFSRGSDATRINSQGLVESVQVYSDDIITNGTLDYTTGDEIIEDPSFEQLGNELVQNGDFEEVGSELITNGGFDDANDYVVDPGWTIANGVATYDGLAINQDVQFNGDFSEANKVYRISFEIVSDDDMNLFFGAGASAIVDYTVYSKGTHVVYGKSPGGGSQFKMYATNINGGNAGVVDNVSIKEVGQNWTFGDSWNMGDGVAVSDGSSSNSNFTYQNILTQNKAYKITLDAVVNSGTLNVYAATNVSQSITSSGTYTFYDVSDRTDLDLHLKAVNFDGSVDNVSVKEVAGDYTFVAGEVDLIDDNEQRKASLTNANATAIKLDPAYYTTVANTEYEITYTISNFSSGLFRVQLGNDFGEWRGSNGTYREILSTSNTTQLWLGGNSAFNGDVHNISLKRITGLEDWNFQQGHTQTVEGGLKFFEGSIINQQTNDADLNGGRIRVSYTLQNVEGTNPRFQLYVNGAWVDQVTENGTFTVDYTSSSTIVYLRNASSANQGTFEITNASVKKITEDTDIPRIDYTNSACPSLLLEPQRTNTIIYSEDLSQANPSHWIYDTVSVEGGYLAPDGSYNAHKVSATDDGSGAFLYAATQTLPTDARSIWARTENGTGVVQLLSHNTNSNNIFTVTEKWQRFEVTSTSSSSGATNFYAVDFRGASSTLTEVILWGAQSEVGDYVSSYIPTRGTTITRLGDVCEDAGDVSLFNRDEGVLYAEIKKPIDAASTYELLSLSDGSTQNTVSFGWTSGGNELFARIIANGVVPFSYILGDYKADTYYKIALKYKSGSSALWIDGERVYYDLDTFSFSQPLKLIQFNYGDAGSYKFYGDVRQLLYFNEALSDAELEYITSSDIDLTIHNYKGSLSKISATYEDVGVKDRLTKLF